MHFAKGACNNFYLQQNAYCSFTIRVNLADGTTGSEFQRSTNLALETDDLNNDDMSINLTDVITRYRPPVNTNMGSELEAEEENHKENKTEGSEDV